MIGNSLKQAYKLRWPKYHRTRLGFRVTFTFFWRFH